MEKKKIVLVGYGQRGSALSSAVFHLFLDKVEFVAVCDVYEDRAKAGADFFAEKQGNEVLALTDYEDVIKLKPDAVIICTSWKNRVNMVCEALEAKIAVASEVGGAYNIDECYRLVETYERTKTPYMFMENCCYGHLEQLALNMKKTRSLGRYCPLHRCVCPRPA